MNQLARLIGAIHPEEGAADQLLDDVVELHQEGYVGQATCPPLLGTIKHLGDAEVP